MAKKHIISIMHQRYAVDSVAAATQLASLLAKARPVRHVTSGSYREWFYTPDEHGIPLDVEIKLNQEFYEPKKPKDEKPLALPKPKRGTILCICEKSSVAPGETCAHCGRGFHESHNRTHGSAEAQPKLRLLP